MFVKRLKNNMLLYILNYKWLTGNNHWWGTQLQLNSEQPVLWKTKQIHYSTIWVKIGLTVRNCICVLQLQLKSQQTVL
jgi:hypothetical protein